MYTLLKGEVERLGKKPNFMTVPAAIRELEKIEMVRGLDGKYRLDHAVTATQKAILSAFQMDEITRQEEQVAKSEAKYDADVMKLKDLYAKQDELKKKELLKAVETSQKSYEEIMAFL